MTLMGAVLLELLKTDGTELMLLELQIQLAQRFEEIVIEFRTKIVMMETIQMGKGVLATALVLLVDGHALVEMKPKSTPAAQHEEMESWLAQKHEMMEILMTLMDEVQLAL